MFLQKENINWRKIRTYSSKTSKAFSTGNWNISFLQEMQQNYWKWSHGDHFQHQQGARQVQIIVHLLLILLCIEVLEKWINTCRNHASSGLPVTCSFIASRQNNVLVFEGYVSENLVIGYSQSVVFILQSSKYYVRIQTAVACGLGLPAGRLVAHHIDVASKHTISSSE